MFVLHDAGTDAGRLAAIVETLFERSIQMTEDRLVQSVGDEGV